MNLVVDIGNTLVKFALFEAGKLVRQGAAESPREEDFTEWLLSGGGAQ